MKPKKAICKKILNKMIPKDQEMNICGAVNNNQKMITRN
jgi:hypothetical protein